MNIASFERPQVSRAIQLILVSLFAILWAIWIQPHTIFLRHLVLLAGSLIGIYVLFQNFHFFRTRSATPAYLIFILLAWITLHLFFLSNQFELQLEEYSTIWKRIIISIPFAISLGMAFASYKIDQKSPAALNDLNNFFKSNLIFSIFYIGMCMPTIIYLIRSGFTMATAHWGLAPPDFLMNLYPPSTWYISKTGYVFFCLPALALACSQLIRIVNTKSPIPYLHIGIVVLTMAAVLAVFYLENIKNGVAYSVLLITAMAIKISFNLRRSIGVRHIFFGSAVIIVLVTMLASHIQSNKSWKTVFIDAKVSAQLDEIDHWKFGGNKGYPQNELGEQVSITNYERQTWGIVALRFIREMPQGYGLVWKSFGYMAKDKWPDSVLTQSHSGWLDLVFGIGIPGVLLIVLSGVLALVHVLRAAPYFLGSATFWMLLSIALLMITTEVSQKVYLEALIFLILVTAGLGLYAIQGNPSESNAGKLHMNIK